MIGYYYIYLIKCNTTGRGYVGRTQKFNQRVKWHFEMLRAGKHSVEEMQKDFDKYGEGSFSFELLDTAKPGDCEINNSGNSKEHKWQEALKTYDIRYGYNYKDTRFHPTARKKKTAS